MKLNAYNIHLVARHVSRLMTRSRYMIFFLLLAYGLAGFLHVNYHSEQVSGVTLSLTYMSSLIPYTNVYLFTLLLLIPVAFWVESFFRQQQRCPDSVIHVRPEGNDEYILGIAWGVLRVILAAGAVSLCVAAVVNLAVSDFPFNGWLYLFYFSVFLLPSFVFIAGVAIFTANVIRHRGIGTFFLLGVIVLAFFPQTHAVDPLGITLASAFSDVTGLAGTGYFIIQRATWLLLGVGLTGFAIASFTRLPNAPRSPRRVRGIALLFLLAGMSCGACIVFSDLQRSDKREEYTATYLKYQTGRTLTLSRHSIRCAHENEQLRARSSMTVMNQTTGTIERPLFYLNPSLRVSSLRVNGEEVDFERDNQVVLVSKEMAPGTTWSVEMEYAGGIDEAICYLDIPEKHLHAPLSYVDCHGGEKYAFLEKNFVLLSPECLWYPVTVPPVNPGDIFNIQGNFTEYSLEVVARAGHTVISQGERSVSGDTVSFHDEHPLRGISLCTGPYESYTASVGGVDYELLLFRGHESLLNGLELLHEKKSEIIQRVMARLNDAPYPFQRLRIVETPVSFVSHYRVQRGASEFVQPEILFLPERLHAMHGANFAGLLALMKRNSREKSDAELVEMIVDDFVKKNFLVDVTTTTGRFPLPVSREKLNPYNLPALFSNHAGYMHAPDFPVMDAVFHVLSSRRPEETKQELAADIKAGLIGSSIVRGIEGHGLKAYVNDPENNPVAKHDVWKKKVHDLIKRVSMGSPEDELVHFVNDYARARPFRQLEFDDFNRACVERFGVDWKEILPAWYTDPRLPTFVIKDFSVAPVEDVEGNTLPLKRVFFRVYNDSEVDGIISVIAQFPNRTLETMFRNYSIPRAEGREVALVVDELASFFFLKMDLSRNIPWMHSFIAIARNLAPPSRDTASYVARVDPGYFSTPPGEIIVDNEDEGFQVHDASSDRWFSSSLKKNTLYTNFFTDISRGAWRTFFTSEAYGRSCVTAVVKRAGSGKAHAEWKTTITEAGEYELFAYIVPVTNGTPGPATYRQYYTVTHAGGTEEVFVDYADAFLLPGKWFSLGRFTLQQGECKVILSDRGDKTIQVIYADAVKWILY
ncbi:MAG: hypothetical protein LBF09_04825, partial [Odoribacteraceae bacterium]|nr:hypothetical protein [Odoribacteraceae bacterium]